MAISLSRTTRAGELSRLPLGPPLWARAVLDAGRDERLWQVPTAGVSLLRGSGFSLATTVVREARGMDRGALHAAVRSAYGRLGDEIAACDTPYAVRMWNFIPGILEPLDDLPHRYMAFNMGRHDAYEAWFDGRGAFACTVPTASGVGWDGNDLWIHALASARPGTPVENPRQVPSYRYSRQFGPLPPCFARATRVDLDGPTLLIGGTASIRGERTLAIGDLEAQCEETLHNLGAVIAAGRGVDSTQAADPVGRRDLLAKLVSVRVYVPLADDRPRVEAVVRDALPEACVVELGAAELCRDGLRVEIEGIAHV
jgi:enamine deaminase RidA (YjgF/YER057c/UK114 family)